MYVFLVILYYFVILLVKESNLLLTADHYWIIELDKEFRVYKGGHHFLSILKEDVFGHAVFALRFHPGNDVNGWGTTVYMQPFLPGATLSHTTLITVVAVSNGIEVSASGFVSRGASSTYGTWSFSGKFTYDKASKDVSAANVVYDIDLDGPLTEQTGDLNIVKIATNYLVGVPLLGGGIGDHTGDMSHVNVDGNGVSYPLTWNPPNQPAFFHAELSSWLSIDVVGQYNNVDTIALGEGFAMKPAVKPSVKIVFSCDFDLMFGAMFDELLGQAFWSDNVAVTPLKVWWSSNQYIFRCSTDFESKPVAGDPSHVQPVVDEVLKHGYDLMVVNFISQDFIESFSGVYPMEKIMVVSLPPEGILVYETGGFGFDVVEHQEIDVAKISSLKYFPEDGLAVTTSFIWRGGDNVSYSENEENVIIVVDLLCSTPCVGNEECIALDTCECNASLWSGPMCDLPVCIPPCNNNENCMTGPPHYCDCDTDLWSGNCDTPICDDPPCVGNEECNAPDTCECNITLWTGGNCDTPVCVSCVGNEKCIAGPPHYCFCNETLWIDDGNCDLPVCSPPCVGNEKCIAGPPHYCFCNETLWIDDGKCNLPVCSPSCIGNEDCIAGPPHYCNCNDTLWIDDGNCDIPICNPSCVGNEKCIAGPPHYCFCNETLWIDDGNCDLPVCNPSCVGFEECIAGSPHICYCNTTLWSGSCDTPICDSPVCVNNEECVAPDDCQCNPALWSGNCDTPICNSCVGNEKCIAGPPHYCNCNDTLWIDDGNCDIPICNPSCVGNEQCIAGTPHYCFCNEALFFGDNCTLITDTSDDSEDTTEDTESDTEDTSVDDTEDTAEDDTEDTSDDSEDTTEDTAGDDTEDTSEDTSQDNTEDTTEDDTEDTSEDDIDYTDDVIAAIIISCAFVTITVMVLIVICVILIVCKNREKSSSGEGDIELELPKTSSK